MWYFYLPVLCMIFNNPDFSIFCTLILLSHETRGRIQCSAMINSPLWQELVSYPICQVNNQELQTIFLSTIFSIPH